MQYPLTEKIGNPELLVGRKKEFTEFNKWLSKIPKRLSKSRVILARRKSGKTAFVQRIFNQLWSANGKVIPFYFEIHPKSLKSVYQKYPHNDVGLHGQYPIQNHAIPVLCCQKVLLHL